MKDLKHLIYFEHLLDEAGNELVMQAVSEGKKAVGYTCYHMPEVLLNLDNCFSVRMRAPRTGSLEISTYYMTNYLCGYTKALGRARHRGRLQLPVGAGRRRDLHRDEPNARAF